MLVWYLLLLRNVFLKIGIDIYIGLEPTIDGKHFKGIATYIGLESTDV